MIYILIIIILMEVGRSPLGAADAKKRASLGVTNYAPSRLARRFHQICLGVLSEITTPHALSPVQYGALASLSIQPAIDQRGLAAVIGIDTVSAHHMVEELVQRGLVRRRVDPEDRRARILSLTARGTKLFRALFPEMRAAHDRILGSLTAAERRTFLDLLKRVVEANQNYARPGNGRRRPKRKAEINLFS
jgi:DNA-binding MarR family transcriptional regulator